MKKNVLILLLLLPLMAWGQTAPLHADAEVRVWSVSHAVAEGFTEQEALDSAQVVLVTWRNTSLYLDNIYLHPAGKRNSPFKAVTFSRADGSETPSRTLGAGDTFMVRCPLRQGLSAGSYRDSLLVMAFTYRQGGGSQRLDTVRLPLSQVVMPTEVVRLCDPSVQEYTLPSGRRVSEDGLYFDTSSGGEVRAYRVQFQPLLTDTLVRYTCDPFRWRGVRYAESGLYEQRSAGADGCDSVHVLELHIQTVDDLGISSDTLIRPGGSARLSVEGQEYCWWYEGNTLIGDRPSITVSPSASTLYRVEVLATTGRSLVENGDFEQGNRGFETEYYYQSNMRIEGCYMVGQPANRYYSGFSTLNNHTPGGQNFMIVNGGDDTCAVVWQQRVEVYPGTRYSFSAWVCTISYLSTQTGRRSVLQFSINGVPLDTAFLAPANETEWQRFFSFWDSDTCTEAVLTLLNFNPVSNGNDFGLDDVEFLQLTCLQSDSMWVYVGEHMELDTTLCASELPLRWMGEEYWTSIDTVYQSGGGVRLHLRLTVLPTYDTTYRVTIEEGEVFDSLGFYVWEPGIYTQSLITQAGCDSTVRLILAVTHLPGEEEPDTLRQPQGDLWVPNAFTPQHEENTLFRARGYDVAQFEMFIFDRAGRQLFHSTDLYEGWDGTYRGCPQPQAAYTWLIRYSLLSRPRDLQTRIGTVTLLRGAKDY